MQTAGQDDSSDADDDPTEAERRMPQPTGKPSIANFDAGFPLDGPKTAAAPPMPAAQPVAPSPGMGAVVPGAGQPPAQPQPAPQPAAPQPQITTSNDPQKPVAAAIPQMPAAKHAGAMMAAPLIGMGVGVLSAALTGNDPVHSAAIGAGVGLGGAAAHRGAKAMMRPSFGEVVDQAAQTVGAKLRLNPKPHEPIWSRAQGSLSPHAIDGIEGGLAGAGALGGGIVGNRVCNLLVNNKKAAALASKVIKRAYDMNTPTADAPPGVASATPSVAAGFRTGVQKPPAMPMGTGAQKAAQLAKDVIKRAYFYPPMMMHPTGQMPLGNPYGHPQGALTTRWA